MEELIEALQIISKYEKPKYPTDCRNEYFYVDVKWKKISKGDKNRLKELGFFKDKDYDRGGIGSFRYGSC